MEVIFRYKKFFFNFFMLNNFKNSTLDKLI